MISFSIKSAIFSLLVSTQIFVESSALERKGPAKVITNLLKVPWINLNSSWAEEVAPTCRDDISTLFESADAGEMWALRMLDASTKIPSGILRGNIRDLGMYDECIRVKGHQNPANIQGQHCMISLSMPAKFVRDAASILYMQQTSPYNPSASVDLSLGPSVCLPSSCSVDDIRGLVNASIRSTPELAEFEVRVDQVTCSSVEAFNNFSLGTIMTIAFLTALAIFLVFCTACDCVVKVNSDHAPLTLRNLAKFSLYSNAIKLWSTDVPDGTFPAINGIRFLSMCVVVMGHRLLSTFIKPMINHAEIFELRDSWLVRFFSPLPYVVDTFFVLSSFFVTYAFLKDLRSGVRFTIRDFYLHRYIRLIPYVVASLLFTAFIVPHLGSGPLWQTIIPFTSGFCQKNWWTNLLFVHNLVNRREMCLPHTWYLAVDMQLFCISPFILYPLFYRPKLGLSILGTLTIAAFVTPFVQIMKHQLPFFVHGNKNSIASYYDFFDFYPVTYNRSLPYFIGMLLGYYVLNNKKELTQAQATFNWFLTCVFGLFLLWSSPFIQPYSPVFNVGWEATYASFGRLGWSLTTAWIIYACIRGYGGLITRFCSLPIFVPLSRMSYGIYISSCIIQAGINSMIRTGEFHSTFAMLYIIGSDLAMSIAAAFVLNLCIESPVIVLVKILTAKHPSEIIKPDSIRHEEKLIAPLVEYLDLPKDRVGCNSISARMLQPDFWQTVSGVLSTLGKRTAKTPAELAKTWQDWESALQSNQRQRRACENGNSNGHANGDANGVINRFAQLQTETTTLEKRLLFFLAAISDGLNDKTRLKES